MNRSRCRALALACLLLALIAPATKGGVISYTNETTFQSQGTIVHNTNFDGVAGGTFFSPGDPYTIGGVTYTTGDNLIVGVGTGYGNARDVFVYNFWSPLPGNISTSPQTFDMFGFSIGVLGSNSLVDITLITNLGTYNFNGLTFPNVNTTPGLAFQGFTTDNPSEYFTGFSIASQNGTGSAPAITDVQLGTQNAVPEPSALALFALCAVSAGYYGYRRRRQVVLA